MIEYTFNRIGTVERSFNGEDFQRSCFCIYYAINKKRTKRITMVDGFGTVVETNNKLTSVHIVNTLQQLPPFGRQFSQRQLQAAIERIVQRTLFHLRTRNDDDHDLINTALSNIKGISNA